MAETGFPLAAADYRKQQVDRTAAAPRPGNLMLLQNCRSVHAHRLKKGCCDPDGRPAGRPAAIRCRYQCSSQRPKGTGQHALVVDVLRIARLGEEETALDQQAGRLQASASNKPAPGRTAAGRAALEATKPMHLRGQAPWKNFARVERAAVTHRLLHHPRRGCWRSAWWTWASRASQPQQRFWQCG